METNPTFEDVLAGACAGEAWAFERLWRSLNAPLTRYLSVAAPGSMEDLASETWLQAARDIRRFRGNEEAFRRWLFTIARHRLIDHNRRVRRRPADPVPPGAFPERIDHRDLIEERRSTVDALALIRTLPPAQAEAVALRFVGGLSVEETARVMGKRPGAIRVLTSRGLHALAERVRSLAERKEDAAT